MVDWLLSHPEWVAAGSTVLLAFFAAVQIWVELSRRAEHRHASASKTIGPAWLARRNCEAVLSSAVGEQSVYRWRETAASAKTLNVMQNHMLRTLANAAEAGGSTAKAARVAFTHFLAYADLVNNHAAFPVSQHNSHGDPEPTQEDRQKANRAARRALEQLRSSIASLEKLAERNQYESPIPDRSEIPLMASAVLEQGQPQETLPGEPAL